MEHTCLTVVHTCLKGGPYLPKMKHTCLKHQVCVLQPLKNPDSRALAKQRLEVLKTCNCEEYDELKELIDNN